MSHRHLADYLEATAGRFPERTAVIDPSGSHLTYAELNRQADALAGFLAGQGVARGDRVGVVLPKSAPAVVALFGILKAGAALPVDFTAPTDRSRGILTDCEISALILIHGRCVDVTPDRRSGTDLPVVVVGAASNSGTDRDRTTTPYEKALESSLSRPSPDRNSEDLAYILYTSGSTGTPKGVMITHANAVSFVEWARRCLRRPRTIVSAVTRHSISICRSSIFTSAMKHGASLHVISEELGKNPKELREVHRCPATDGLVLDALDPDAADAVRESREPLTCSSLRLVLFAGEVFPVKHLRRLKQLLASSRVLQPVRADRNERVHVCAHPRDDSRRPGRCHIRSASRARTAMRSC